jgi:hypothetical protein
VTHYSFAHLDQRTLSMNLRVNYTARPDLTLELYAEPFVSTGTYSNFRELSATPAADEFEERFTPFTPPAGSSTGFNFSQLRTNAVARWEYMPGRRCSWCGRTGGVSHWTWRRIARGRRTIAICWSCIRRIRSW